MPNKGYDMYDTEVIEMEEFSLNHYLHHFDESEIEYTDYNKEHDCMAVVAECFEDISLDERYTFD